MPELEDRLRALRGHVEWPPTPDLAAAVVARVETAPQRRRAVERRALRWPRRLAVAVALALLVPAAAAVAFPSARDDVLEWLGLKGATITRSPQPPPAGLTSLDELGRPVSLGEAPRVAGFAPAVPSALGAPREVRFDPRSRFVTLVYDDVLVGQARGALNVDLVGKLVGPDVDVRPVTVNGARGAFVDGSHSLQLNRPGAGPPRLAQRALVFNRGDVLVRVEGKTLTRERALAIARSLR